MTMRLGVLAGILMLWLLPLAPECRAADGAWDTGTPAAGYTLDDPRFAREAPGDAQAHCNTRYAHDELFPLRHDCTFYDLALALPARPEPALRRALGDDFMTVARARTPAGLVTFALRDASPA